VNIDSSNTKAKQDVIPINTIRLSYSPSTFHTLLITSYCSNVSLIVGDLKAQGPRGKKQSDDDDFTMSCLQRITFVHLDARLLLQVEREVCPPIVTGVHHTANTEGKYLRGVVDDMVENGKICKTRKNLGPGGPGGWGDWTG
jgi:hypothetical protein